MIWRFLLAWYLGLALVLGAANLVFAHEGYEGWNIPGTQSSCCNDKDCAPVSAWFDGKTWQIWWKDNREYPFSGQVEESHDCQFHACVQGSVKCFRRPVRDCKGV